MEPDLVRLPDAYETLQSELVVNNAQATDSGNYTCRYKAFGDTIFRRSTTIEIFVHRKLGCVSLVLLCGLLVPETI